MATPSPSPATAVAAACAWRARFRMESTRGQVITVARRCDYQAPAPPQAFDAPHCAELVVKSGISGNAARVTPLLGELLRLVQLAAAQHVDPLVLNALWDDDALCAMGPAQCARCDDADHVVPTVTFWIARDYGRRWGFDVVYNALYAWQEATASDEFRQLRDALGPGTTNPVQLKLLLGQPYDDQGMMLREVEALVARSRATQPADSLRVRIVGIYTVAGAARVSSPHFARLHTAIVDLDVETHLLPLFHDRATSEENQQAWRWLIDRAERTNTSPRVAEAMIHFRPGVTADMLTKLLEIVVTKNAALRRLSLQWPLHMETDADERRRAAEAIGAALFGPRARSRLDKLEIELGDVADEDVDAMQRGTAQSTGEVIPNNGATATSRYELVEWKTQCTSERCIEHVVRLLGVVGVCELEIDAGGRALSCHTLRTALQDCAATITSLNWVELDCSDATELEHPTTWSKVPRALRKLRVLVRDEHAHNTLVAINALLARVGPSLTSFEVAPLGGGVLTAGMAKVIVARCPQLRALSVVNATAEFYEHLTQAFDDGRCGVTTLTAMAMPHTRASGWYPLLEALQDATRSVSRQLRVLALETIWPPNRESTPLFKAFIKTFSANATLTRIALQESFRATSQRQLQALPHQLVVRRPSLRRRLALISACRDQNDPRFTKLPPDVLDHVFAFAGRRTPRYEY